MKRRGPSHGGNSHPPPPKQRPLYDHDWHGYYDEGYRQDPYRESYSGHYGPPHHAGPGSWQGHYGPGPRHYDDYDRPHRPYPGPPYGSQEYEARERQPSPSPKNKWKPPQRPRKTGDPKRRQLNAKRSAGKKGGAAQQQQPQPQPAQQHQPQPQPAQQHQPQPQPPQQQQLLPQQLQPTPLKQKQQQQKQPQQKPPQPPQQPPPNSTPSASGTENTDQVRYIVIFA